jgi:zinc and cadmium transporter
MDPLLNIILLVTFGSVISLAAGFLLLSRQTLFRKLQMYLVAFAAGTLIGTALFDLLPEALDHSEELGIDGQTPFFFAALGIVFFFILEKFLHWYHDHVGRGPGEPVTKEVVPLIAVSDGLHNFVDGALIAATTLIDPQLGIVTAVAIFLHEIPQEVGDFSIFVFGGLTLSRAILYNLLSALTAYVGAFFTIILSGGIATLTTPLVALAAGGFLFIALSELVPELIHKEKRGIKTAVLAITFVGGIFFIRYLDSLLSVH